MKNDFINSNTFKQTFIDNVERTYAISFDESTPYQQYVVLGQMVREHIASDWNKTNKMIKENQLRQVHYFSMEFLMGRMITNNIMNAGLREVISEAFDDLGLDLNAIEHMETDAGLGNGGLGRLAACFMDSVASLGLPVHGNCIRYRYGFFKQGIQNGYQIEHPDRWLKDIHVWEIRKDDEAVEIPFYGNIEIGFDNGELKIEHKNAEFVKAVPYDVPMIGDHNHIVNTLRLWSAEPANTYAQESSSFDYHRKLREISAMLYPNDETDEGKILRLKQQYLFSAAGVKNIVRQHKKVYNTLENFHEKVVLHINDTHPVLIIPELMRILVDEEKIPWDQAWNITKNSCAYTNHTLLAEALEKWSIALFAKLLPRVYTITEEINRRYVEELVERFGEGHENVYKMAILRDGMVHMAHLAIVGSFSVNGVAALHTKLLKEVEMKEFDQFYPNKFNNKTNGITHRRWAYHTNPELVSILKDTIGEGWVKNTEELSKLLPYANDPKIQKRFEEMKFARKVALAERIKQTNGIEVNPHSIFDIQVKRLHEYKRQLMNALHIMHVYNKLKSDADFKANYVPHTFIFGAKSAPSYHFAKKVIKLINTIADKVNNDPDTNHLLKAVFVIDYNVTYAEVIMPAADLSEQISTASKEASGTGNMKFMMNGAITIGTLDGANVEIAELVGQDNILIFGLTADEVNALYQTKSYNPQTEYFANEDLKLVIDQLTNGHFDNVKQDEFQEIRENLLNRDSYLVLKDFNAYASAHALANTLYKDRQKWLSMSITNTAQSGFFSTDRTMKQYNEDIWKLTPYK